MDLELLFWVVVFVGGYSVVLGYLLRIAMRTGGTDRPEGPADA